ncbi:polysaccharide export protein, BexD/CtrA/VexA family [Pedobacter sp. BAL39]|uniref:polysaccharide biosynthesis/export family protein n=1 Tax=Pedobacter sp. BAL39 TaxID=391596 RepID=UPI0001559A94|nr:polysaccharide biosynthesis/export family protein [Pedobacter sp. BAL39]EDM38323.1 polysaccharide export protein, BexD/CtrA/VexA family [Pedobacter sp. BAL39]
MKFKIIIYSLFLIIVSGCARQRNLVYFSDLSNKDGRSGMISGNGESRILKNDVLSLTVKTSSEATNALYASNSSSINASGVYEKEGYRVNELGMINLPLLGEVKIGGLTLAEAEFAVTAALKKNTVKGDVMVNIKFMNFRITVIGEVNHPSTFSVQNEKITLLEALGMAGDMTAYGKRENVLLIREVDGERVLARVNLNHKEALNSPYFYLRQNDVIYVEPDKAKSVEYSNSSRTMPLVVATISAVAVLATALLNR